MRVVARELVNEYLQYADSALTHELPLVTFLFRYSGDPRIVPEP